MSGTNDSPRPSPRPRPSPKPVHDGATATADEHTSTVDEHTHTSTVDNSVTTAGETGATGKHATHHHRGRKRDARATLLSALVGCFILLAAATVWFAIEVDTLRSGEPDENTALVDSDVTDAVTADVSAELKSVFSYNYTNLDRTKRAADRALLEHAQRQYKDRFAEVTDNAKKDELMRTASVRDIGVREIDGDTAELVVFLDQQTLTNKDEQSGQQTISLEIGAKLVDGTWKVAEFDSK